MNKCKIILLKEASEDIINLPEFLQKECLNTLERLEKNIHLGIPLEDKNGRDLTGYFKLYFNNAKHRIIYKKTANDLEVAGIVSEEKLAEVIGVGKRDKEYIYKIVATRIDSNNK